MPERKTHQQILAEARQKARYTVNPSAAELMTADPYAVKPDQEKSEKPKG